MEVWEAEAGYLMIYTEDMRAKIKIIPFALYFSGKKIKPFARQFRVEKGSEDEQTVKENIEKAEV